MKKFTKFMLSAAAITTVSAAMAVSAMAADTITGSYNKETGIVTLSGVVSSGVQQTLLVLTKDENVTNENSDIIAQIDQQESIAQFKLKAGMEEEKTYYVRVGGSDGKIQTGTLTINKAGTDAVTIIIGDIDQSGDVSISDVTALARGNAGKKQAKYKNEWVGDTYKVESVNSGTYNGENLVIGDIDQSDDVSISDVTALARGNAGKKQAKYKNECVGAEVSAVPAAQ